MPKDFLTALPAGGQVAQIRLRLARKKVVGCQLSPRPGPPKDFSGPAAAGGGDCTRALAATPEKWPKVLRSWHKRLGIRQLRGRKKRVDFDTHVWHS
jgi:hypothetical protein